jgi:hypothetical protein
MVASFLAGSLFANPVRIGLDDVSVHRKGLGIAVDAQFGITPRVRVTFDSVDGTLHIAEHKVDYVVTGLQSGDVLEPATTRHVSITVNLSALDAGAILLGAAKSGKLALDFDGTVHASMLGIPLAVPVTFERAVSY